MARDTLNERVTENERLRVRHTEREIDRGKVSEILSLLGSIVLHGIRSTCGDSFFQIMLTGNHASLRDKGSSTNKLLTECVTHWTAYKISTASLHTNLKEMHACFKTDHTEFTFVSN